MPRASLTHDAVWVRQLAEQLTSRGFGAKQLFAQVGLDEENINGENARIPFAKHASFFELAATVSNDPCLGLHFGQTRDTRDAGLIGYVGLSSATLFDGIESMSRYRRVFSDASEFEIHDLPQSGRFRWWYRGLDTPLPRQCLEFAAINMLRAFRDACGRRLTPQSVTFVHRRRENVDAFEQYCGCPVIFECDANIIEMKPCDLALPLRTADDRLLNILRRYCREVLSHHSVGPPSLVENIERLVADKLTNGRAQFGIIALELGMSPRSLSRKLAESGTTFTQIVETLRKKLALHYIQERNLSFTEIAFLLGYSEVSTFNHAFKRWTGITPTAFRQKS